MKLKKQLVLILSLCLVFAFSTLAYAQDTGLNDVSGHWAEPTINKWSAEGIVGGYPDGTFQPNRSITRAEFITIINKALGCSLQGNVNFSDVKNNDWFYGEIAKAVKSGYIKGYEDRTFKPNNPISRQEAAVIFSRIMCLKGNVQGLSAFADKELIPAWSKDMVGAVAAAGYMGGYPDKTFQPTRSITRAESVVTLDRLLGAVYNVDGVAGSETETTTFAGNVTVTAKNLTLQNIVVEGNLYLAEGIGEGTVTLKDVTVKGNTIVRGGGIHSIIMYNFNGQTIVVDVPDGSNVRLVARGTSSLEDVVLESNAILEEDNLSGEGFTTVIIPAGAEVVLNGTFDNVTVQGAGASVKVESGSINNLNVDASAANANVNLAEGTSVSNLTVEAPAKVSGKGTINTAVINSSNVSIEQKPNDIKLSDDAANVIIEGKEVTGKTSEEETTGGGGGGGSSGGGTPSISINEITLTFDSKAENIKDNSKPFTFDLSDTGEYPDNALFTGIIIGGTNVNDGTLVITQVNMANQNWLGSSIEAPISEDGVVSTRDILKGLDTGTPGVNLGSLREFGEDIIITGYVKKSGYTSSTSITVTLHISDSGIGDLSGVVNPWLDFEKNGITVTGTIKAGKENTKLKDVEILSFLWGQGQVSITSIGSGYVTGEEAIKAKIAELAGVTWDTAELGHLSGKTIYFKPATGAYRLEIQ